MKKTETKYYCDFCHKECTDKHHKLIIPTIEQLAVNSSDQSTLGSSEVDVCHRCAEMVAVTLNMIARHTQQCEKCNGSITRDVIEYENSSKIKRIKITIDCDYSKKKQEE